MKIAEAKTKLEAAGYHIEYTSGNANVAVRTSPNAMPTQLRTVGGHVSPLSVKRLLNATFGKLR